MDRKMYVLNGRYVVDLPEYSCSEEAGLQTLIEDNPFLVAREWEDNDHKQFYLIDRELKSQIAEDDGNSFFLDILLVDNDGVPILVEVKRCANTQIRRLVVAQILDYASRAAAWKVEELKEKFQKNNSKSFPDDINDAFWSNVATNLKSEHFRLVFAADEIPDTLRNLILFLDRSMRDIEVYGVEIRQYKSGDTTIISPNIIGNSPDDPRKPASELRPSPRTWTREEFINLLEQRDLSSLKQLASEIMDYSSKHCGAEWVSAFAWKYPSQHAMIKGKWLFSIEIASKKVPGYYCAAVFNLMDLPMYLGEDWNTARLRETLLSFPSYAWAKERNLIWGDGDKNKWLYIDLRALRDDACVDTFKNTLKMLANEMQNNDNLDA